MPAHLPAAPWTLARIRRGIAAWRSRTLRVVLVTLACLVPGVATGQGVTATIEGRVVDQTTLPVAGVTILAVNLATGFQRMTTTDDAGRYLLLGLPVEGEYDIRAQGPGFAVAVRERVMLRPDQALVVDFTLRVAAQDTIAV